METFEKRTLEVFNIKDEITLKKIDELKKMMEKETGKYYRISQIIYMIDILINLPDNKILLDMNSSGENKSFEQLFKLFITLKTNEEIFEMLSSCQFQNTSGNKMSEEDARYLARYLMAIGFENSFAYEEAVSKEDPIARMERIEKALLDVQYKEGMAYQKLLQENQFLK